MEKKYQVFLSSTYIDLQEQRKAIQDMIISMNHFPVGMELFSAADEEQWSIISRTIDSSDYYVLILGHRYGTIIESGDEAGISYTEKEYRYAVSKGIPVLAFIIQDNVPIQPDQVDYENRAKLEAFKSAVKTGRIVQWWSNTDELKSQVMIALHKQIVEAKRPGWVRADALDVDQATIAKMQDRIAELEKENRELISRTQTREPKLTLSIATDIPADEQEAEMYDNLDLVQSISENMVQMRLATLYDIEDIKERYKPIIKSEIPYPDIKRSVSDEKIKAYNDALPPADQVEEYVNAVERYERIRKGGAPFQFDVCNVGKAKATDIVVEMDFPDELLVMPIMDAKYLDEPREPSMPRNPVDEAILRREGYGEFISWEAVESKPYKWRPILANNTYFDETEVVINDHSIDVETQSILHTKSYWFRGVYIVPLKEGIYKVRCSLMCAEYEAEKVQEITFIVN